jgi:hypothetical protein
MAFGMGFGELAMILFIFVAVFGSTKFPGADNWFRRMRGPDPMRARLYGRAPAHWTLVDYLLLATTLGLAATLALSYAQGN